MVAGYRLVFQIDFEHAFFGDGVARCFKFAPTEACSAMLARAGLLLRPLSGGLAVYADDAGLARLRLHVAEAGSRLKLGFLVYSSDPHFAEYTVPAPRRGALLFFDSRRAAVDGEGRRVLHQGAQVSEESFRPLDHKRVLCLLGDERLRYPPVAAVALGLDEALLALPPDARGRRFLARFEAGACRWKYLLFGALGERAGAITDAGGHIEFKSLGRIEVEERRHAAVFLSQQEIPMRERHEQRFELREKPPNVEKVLIKRMPNASLGTRYRHQQDGADVLVSEIFINQ